MLFCDVEIELDDGNNNLIEDESKYLPQHSMPPPNDLFGILPIIPNIHPRNGKNIHSMQVILHPQILIPLHLNKLLHKLFEAVQIALPNEINRHDLSQQVP